MNNKKPKTLSFKPYARLLTMLGEQLIKNERIALVELIKNSYDADANWVKVTFENFDEEFRPLGSNAKIIIEDDGLGMDRDIIENHWVNPATPSKLLKKKVKQNSTTRQGRVIQGEKGIGRFALLKLGRYIEMTTRAKNSSSESTVKLDISKYDEDFLNNDQGMFLDEIKMSLSDADPAEIIIREKIPVGGRNITRKPHGTRIEISHLQSAWTREKVKEVYRDLMRLQSIFDKVMAEDQDTSEHEALSKSTKPKSDFDIYIFRNKSLEPFGLETEEDLHTLLREKTVFRIDGRYDEVGKVFDFSINEKHQKISLLDPVLTGLKMYRDAFFIEKKNILEGRSTECGSFSFKFYIFNLSLDAAPQHSLGAGDKDLIRDHRIYLYRDGIRVYPYGDPTDDWLQIDVRRGTVRANEFVSNDQTVGVIEITQEHNKNLRDKTSREGLVDVGVATDDFRSLIQVFLAWVRKDPYDKAMRITKNSKDIAVFKGGVVEKGFDDLNQAIEEQDTIKAAAALKEIKRTYQTERRYLVKRAEDTEHLAGVGLSVEAASHDLMLSIESIYRCIDNLINEARRGRSLDPKHLETELSTIRGMVSFIERSLGDMQTLFRSTKQRRKQIRVADLLQRVHKLYAGMLHKNGIEYEFETLGSPLVASTTDAVLLQVLLNLFDNSCYWLTGRKSPRIIKILLDGDRGVMIFSDNGPGFREDDMAYLFEPFFSGKGDEGRGLGLYIARQLLSRHEYAIDVSDKQDRLLPGANLTISFVKE